MITLQRSNARRFIALSSLAVFAQIAWASDALTFFNNWFVTGDYVVAGVGLRGTGIGGWATGTINMTGVPTGAEPVAAFLYWSTSEPTTTPAARVGYFNGQKIQGDVLGNPQSPNLPCYSSGGTLGLPGTAGQVYRSDVLRYLPVDANNIRQANGKQTVKLPDSGGNGNGNLLYTEGASLVVIYRIVTPGHPTAAPLRAVVIYNGAFSMDKHSSGMTQTVAGFYQASASAAAKITNIVANGQSGFSSPLSVNGTTLSASPFVGAQGTRWDNPTFNFNLAQNASSFSTLATVGGNQTCLTWAAIVASMAVKDTDNDGLLDVWETNGLHRNTQVSPATFGTCTDYPKEPCVDLPKMGANPAIKDIFIQIDWMHGTGTGMGGIDGAGTHDHIPKMQALQMVYSAFFAQGIAMHFDVGNNYQGLGLPFIIPATADQDASNNAQGGSDMDERTLVCHSNANYTCTYSEPYPVLSFEFGFASVRDGNHLLNIPAHFAQNRKDIFHYALFAHALAGPFNAQGQAVNPATGQVQNPAVPLSYSGIAQRPGGGFMVTFGLWPSGNPQNDMVGNVRQQAGTLMHELGHNLSLLHDGLTAAPNCAPNYASVMNYMYQAQGLTNALGDQVDYSYGDLNPLNEDALSLSNPIGAKQRYAIRFFAPKGPNTPSQQPAAQLHCDGSPTNGEQEVVFPNPPLPGMGPLLNGTPDWSNGTIPLGQPIPPIDVSFTGASNQKFTDQPDWTSINLQQIGTGDNFGGLSVGAFASDNGVYASDAGALASDAGALASDSGVFASDSGVFASDAGAFASDGGVFASDSGALASDSGALASDAGDLDNVTLILSSSAGPPTGVTATNTINSIQLAGAAPDGNIVEYNIYRCAVIAPATSCKPLYDKTINASPGSFGYTDPVTSNGALSGGAGCPVGETCPNTTYTYAVTSVAMVNSTTIESGFSNFVTSEVTRLFVVADVNAVYSNDNTYTYDGNYHQGAFHVFGDVSSSLTHSTVTCTPSARNAGTYPITCTGPTQTSATDAVVYITSGASYVDGAGMHTGGSLIINQRPITVTGAANSKTYDSTTSASSLPTPTVTIPNSVNLLASASPLGAGDSPNFSEAYTDKNAGTGKTLMPSGSVNDGNGGNNYALTFVNSQNGVINTEPLTAKLTAQNKVYDLTNTEPNSNMSCTLTGVITGETLTCTPSAGTFNSYQVTMANLVTATATFTATAPTLASNYTFGAANTTTSITFKGVGANANITTLPLTATLTSAPPKTYDGTTTETNPMTCSVATVLSPDVLSCTASNGNFNTSQVATANLVTATATISGTAVSNYTLGAGLTTVSVTSTGVSVASSITQAPSATTVTCPPGPYIYTGLAQTPCSATVTGAGGLSVTPTPLSYMNNTSAGQATASYTYAGDANHTGSNGSMNFTILQATPTVTDGGPAPATPAYGQPVTLTVTVAPPQSGEAPTGTVTFSFTLSSITNYICSDGSISTTQCTVPVTPSGGNYVASVTTSKLPTAAENVMATYSGDTDFQGETANNVSVTVSQANSAVTLTKPTDPSTYGSAVSLTVEVVDATGGSTGVPTGTVTLSFKLDPSDQNGQVYYICADGTLSTAACASPNQIILAPDPKNPIGATATVQTTALPAGLSAYSFAYPINASYSGDTNFAPSGPFGLSQTVNQLPVTATAGSYSGTYDGGMHSPPACAVTPIAPSTFTGTLTCTNNPTSVGPNAGSGTVTPVPTVGAGDSLNNYAITSVGSWNITPATANITVTGYSVTYDGSPHTATGTATGVGGVVLSADLNLSGTTHTNAQAYIDSWSFVDPTGNYVYKGLTTVTDNIGQASTTTTVSSVSPSPATAGLPVAVTVTVAPVAPGAGTPTGSVTVNSSSAGVSCTVTPLSGGTGSCMLTFAAAGPENITATYTSNSSNFNGSGPSAAFALTVNSP